MNGYHIRKESTSLEWIITIADVGYESNLFDYEKLEEKLMPETDFSIFISYKPLLTHIYNIILV